MVIQVKGFEYLYTVDEDGAIFSLISNKYLKLNSDKDGYLLVHLRYKGTRVVKKVHRLVLEHFRPIENSKNMQVNHIDGDKSNNRLDNLEWVSRKQNIAHAIKHNLNAKGEKIKQSKLSEKDVQNIRKLYNSLKFDQTQLAKMFNVSYSNINYIVRNLTWRHLL